MAVPLMSSLASFSAAAQATTASRYTADRRTTTTAGGPTLGRARSGAGTDCFRISRRCVAKLNACASVLEKRRLRCASRRGISTLQARSLQVRTTSSTTPVTGAPPPTSTPPGQPSPSPSSVSCNLVRHNARPLTRGSETELAATGEIPGVEFPPDSGAGLPGTFWYPTSADPGPMLRSFARTGHWDGIAQTRSNYDTVMGQKVLKVLFKKGRATGVKFVPANATSAKCARSVKARKEIILAAGTIHTPQILQGSGVGPAKLLKSAKIDVVVDLPGVGTNFQDHSYQVGALFNCESSVNKSGQVHSRIGEDC